jgi:hypothetical protein
VDSQGRESALQSAGHLEAEDMAADSLLEELKKFASRLASFGLGEETGRLLQDEGVRPPARAVTSPRLGQS